MKTNTSRIARATVPALLIALTALPAPADMIDASAFSHTLGIQFPAYAGSSTLTDFPVLVKLSAATGFQYAKAAADGADLRFALEDGTLLSHEIDTWDANGTSCVWVKIPSFSAATKIKAYYGCSGIPPAVSAGDVWSNGYVGVWHLNEGQLPLTEASGTQMSFTEKTGTISFGAPGAIGGALDMSRGGWGACVTAAHDDRLSGFMDFTFEIWTKQEALDTNNNRAFFNKRENYNVDLSYYLYQNKDNGKGGAVATLVSTNGSSTVYLTGNSILQKAGAWTHVAITRDTAAEQFQLFLDGGRVWYNGLSGQNPIWMGSSPLELGGSHLAAPIPGQVDEFRISNVSRSQDWLQASYDCVMKDDFCTFFSADADWGDYTHRFEVSFPNVEGTLGDFPVLVRIAEYDAATGTGIDGFLYSDCLLPGGEDLRFTLPDGTALSCEVDTWDTSGESLVWVKIPSLASATKIVGYYGNIAPHSVTPSDVWSNGYKAVWHLGESASPLYESTGNAPAFREATVAPVYAASGAVGKAVDFTNSAAASARLSAADDDDLDGFEDFTVEFWSYQESFLSGQFAGILAKRNSSYNQEAWFFYQNNSGNSIPMFAFSPDSSSARRCTFNASSLPPTGQWVHQVFSRKMDTGDLWVYYNGSSNRHATSSNASATAPVFAGTAPLYLGGGTSQNSFPGKIDEVRISSVVRSAAWVKASHDTVMESTFATYGPARENKKGMVIFFR